MRHTDNETSGDFTEIAFATKTTFFCSFASPRCFMSPTKALASTSLPRIGSMMSDATS